MFSGNLQRAGGLWICSISKILALIIRLACLFFFLVIKEGDAEMYLLFSKILEMVGSQMLNSVREMRAGQIIDSLKPKEEN